MKTSLKLPLLFFIALFLISGCASQGAKRIPADRFDYNAAISSSAREQMLLNIVRSRYQEMPVFLDVGSMVAQYSYIRGAGLSYFREFINNSIAPTSDTASAEVNVGFSEFPTITYVPLAGESFAKHLYSEVPAEIFFASAQAGYSVDLLMRIGLQRIGASENMSFAEVRVAEQSASDIKKLERFARTVDIIYVLNNAQLIKFQMVKGDIETDTETGEKTGENTQQLERYFIIADEVPEDMRPLVAELRQLLGITNGNRFRIIGPTADISEDEIPVQGRSVIAMMKFMGRGVEIPVEHLERGWVVDYGLQTSKAEAAKRLFPFIMRSSRNRPNNAFAAVSYQDYWFYIEQQDIISKRALEHLMIMYQLKAPLSESTGPVLTMPTR